MPDTSDSGNIRQYRQITNLPERKFDYSSDIPYIYGLKGNRKTWYM